MVLEKTLESPLDCKEIQPVHSEEDQPWDFFGRKVMTNLDSILKSRDITLPTKVHLVKAMVFPVVMYDYSAPPLCLHVDLSGSWQTLIGAKEICAEYVVHSLSRV